MGARADPAVFGPPLPKPEFMLLVRGVDGGRSLRRAQARIAHWLRHPPGRLLRRASPSYPRWEMLRSSPCVPIESWRRRVPEGAKPPRAALPTRRVPSSSPNCGAGWMRRPERSSRNRASRTSCSASTRFGAVSLETVGPTSSFQRCACTRSTSRPCSVRSPLAPQRVRADTREMPYCSTSSTANQRSLRSGSEQLHSAARFATSGWPRPRPQPFARAVIW
jgi:hypothetical protein